MDKVDLLICIFDYSEVILTNPDPPPTLSINTVVLKAYWIYKELQFDKTVQNCS